MREYSLFFSPYNLSNLHLPRPTKASSINSSSVMQGDAEECGEGGMTRGLGAGLLTICTLTDGLAAGGKAAGGGGGGGGVLRRTTSAACVITRSVIVVR